MSIGKKSKNTAKYRPVLTADQIMHILYLAKREMPMSNLSFSVIGTLAPFAAKIEVEVLAPAYITAPPAPSLMESLGGFSESIQQLSKLSSIKKEENTGVPEAGPQIWKTKEERWAASYALYQLYPEKCTLQEIKEAQEHMYLNDLMTPEQLAKFESQIIEGL